VFQIVGDKNLPVKSRPKDEAYKQHNIARDVIFTAMKIHILVLRAVTPCSYMVGCKRFRWLCCLHHCHCDNRYKVS